MAIRKKIHKTDKKLIIEAFTEMAKAKNIDKDLLQGIIEETLKSIVEKKYGKGANFEIIVNMQKGDIEIYLIKQIVQTIEDPETEISLEEANQYSTEQLSIGDDFIEEITLDNIADSFGRRLVNYASQAMNLKINEIERNNIYQEYSGKIGQLIIGTIFQKRAAIMLVTHNGVEMKLPRTEQLPSDNIFYKKDRAIKTIIKEVNPSQSGSTPEIILSRKSDDFVRKLFEMEVPEISDGLVIIKSIAREAGERMKISIASVIDRIDPVGACVGIKGIRISSIIRELGNETIDLIPYYDDPIKMIEKSLSPAKVKEIELFPDTRTANVVMAEDQIPLAVGKNGLNIKLAARLTEYDIKLITEGDDDVEIQEFVEEIGADVLNRLLKNDIKTARDFLETPPHVLLYECNIDIDTICDIRRVLLLEFDEPENEDYIVMLKGTAENTIEVKEITEAAEEETISEVTTEAE